MLQELSITIAPEWANDVNAIKQVALQYLNVKEGNNVSIKVLKKSLDARGRNPKFIVKCLIGINEPIATKTEPINYPLVHKKPEVIIIGAGPAGLFCALQFIELGIKPIIIERGKNVRDRRRDLASLNRIGELNEDSNYCFGEGGAGTYSDGKLYTRSGKRGSIDKILKIFHQFGAAESILIDAHPHIGTNKLPEIIAAMRNQIIASGGEVHFNTKLINILVKNNQVVGIETNNGKIETKNVVLATGHSAADIYNILNKNNIALEAKPLAIGVRVEHPQAFVDEAQYHTPIRNSFLPPASYSLVQQVNGRGVFSFCMCPGGIVACASTQHNALVVNGWSPSKRNNPYANSGMVVALEAKDYKVYEKHGALAGLYFQNSIEEKAFIAGGGNFVAPAQKLTDFVANKTSNNLPVCSYTRGVKSVSLSEVLPKNIFSSLQQGFIEFNKKIKGYIHPEAIVIATESRTSAPVRIPRDKETLEHVQVKGLFPCAEGAGYAGGIVSSAIDGENIALAVYKKISNKING